MKKYEFTGETQIVSVASKEVTLHRIRALAGFGIVSAGELGGWIEKEENLSHEGNAWVYGDAIVCDNSIVRGSAKVYDSAKVYNGACICDSARVCGNTEVYDSACVCGNAEVCDSAKVYGNAWVYDNARVHGHAEVYDNAWVYDNAQVYDNARIYDNAQVYGEARVCDSARLRVDADVFSPNHILIIGSVGSRNAFTTFYRGRNKQIIVKCGCFSGTLDQFFDKVKKTHGDNHHALVYRAAVEVARLQISLEDEIPEKEAKHG